jgi:hypothetical protein
LLQVKIFEKINEDYLFFNKKCKELKEKLEECIETKSAYDNVMNILKSEIESIIILNLKDDSILRNSIKENNKFPFKKKYSLDSTKPNTNQNNNSSIKNTKEQISKISSKLKKINNEIELGNKKLLKSVSYIPFLILF